MMLSVTLYVKLLMSLPCPEHFAARKKKVAPLGNYTEKPYGLYVTTSSFFRSLDQHILWEMFEGLSVLFFFAEDPWIT